jgi:hypothetical protein
MDPDIDQLIKEQSEASNNLQKLVIAPLNSSGVALLGERQGHATPQFGLTQHHLDTILPNLLQRVRALDELEKQYHNQKAVPPRPLKTGMLPWLKRDLGGKIEWLSANITAYSKELHDMAQQNKLDIEQARDKVQPEFNRLRTDIANWFHESGQKKQATSDPESALDAIEQKLKELSPFEKRFAALSFPGGDNPFAKPSAQEYRQTLSNLMRIRGNLEKELSQARGNSPGEQGVSPNVVAAHTARLRNQAPSVPCHSGQRPRI